MVYIAYFIFHISHFIFHISYFIFFWIRGSQKGGGGPTFGKNSQIISFFLFESVPNLHHHHPFFNRTSVQPNHFSQYRINDQQHQHFADTMTILIFTGTVLLITIISNQPNQHHHYKINDQQHQQHCNLNLCRHSALPHHAKPSTQREQANHHLHLTAPAPDRKSEQERKCRTQRKEPQENVLSKEAKEDEFTRT